MLLRVLRVVLAVRISITSFADMGVCECKPFLRLVVGATPEYGKWVRAGVAHHAASAREDAARGYERVSEGELKEILRDSGSIVELPSESLSVEFPFKEMVFAGRMDKFLKLGNKVLVVDEKFVRETAERVHERYQLQLGAYCLALAGGSLFYRRGRKKIHLGDRLFHDYDVRFKVVERSAESRETLFESEELSPLFHSILGKMRRFCGIINGEVEPRQQRGSRCYFCELRSSCAHPSEL